CENSIETTGTARWQLGERIIRGTLDVKLGGKNMTLYQRVTGTPVGDCPPPLGPRASVRKRQAWELLVEMNGSGETLAIVQPAEQTFDEGEKVRGFTRRDGSARVAKL